MVSEQQLFKQVAQLSQRDRAAGWVSYRVAVGPERTGTPFRLFSGRPERRFGPFKTIRFMVKVDSQESH